MWSRSDKRVSVAYIVDGSRTGNAVSWIFKCRHYHGLSAWSIASFSIYKTVVSTGSSIADQCVGF